MLFLKLQCLIFGHDRLLMPMDQVEREGWIYGVIHPWDCRRCGYQSFRAKCPPMPPCKPVKSTDIEKIEQLIEKWERRSALNLQAADPAQSEIGAAACECRAMTLFNCAEELRDALGLVR